MMESGEVFPNLAMNHDVSNKLGCFCNVDCLCVILISTCTNHLFLGFYILTSISTLACEFSRCENTLKCDSFKA